MKNDTILDNKCPCQYLNPKTTHLSTHRNPGNSQNLEILRTLHMRLVFSTLRRHFGPSRFRNCLYCKLSIISIQLWMPETFRLHLYTNQTLELMSNALRTLHQTREDICLSIVYFSIPASQRLSERFSRKCSFFPQRMQVRNRPSGPNARREIRFAQVLLFFQGEYLPTSPIAPGFLLGRGVAYKLPSGGYRRGIVAIVSPVSSITVEWANNGGRQRTLTFGGCSLGLLLDKQDDQKSVSCGH